MPGKKIPMNRHAAAAAERKQKDHAERSAAAAQAEEDAFWADQGDKKQQKKAQREQAKAEKQREKQASQDVKKALEREEAARDAEKVPTKVTRAQIQKEMGKMRGGYAGGAAVAQKQAKVVTEEQQQQALEAHEQRLRDSAGDTVDASGLKEAAEKLGRAAIAEDKKEELHPERRMKAAHQAFEERNLPRLKAENPGLKHSQLKEMCWKEWQKSPENPLVQAAMKRMQQD